jgi:hypothetical protein
MMRRTCLQCSHVLTGRRDQKFCSDYCRNTFNNRKNEDATEHMRRVNNILRKNRRILKEYLLQENNSVSGLQLAEEGFNFHYFTNTYRTREGIDHFFCYDHGYVPLENDQYTIVLKKDSSR